MLSRLHHDLDLPVHLTSAYRSDYSHFVNRYPRTKKLIEETIAWSEVYGEKVLVIHSVNTMECGTTESTDSHVDIINLDKTKIEQAMRYMRSFYPQTIDALYNNLVENVSRTGVFGSARYGDKNLMAACIVKRMLAFRYMRQTDLLVTDLWLLFNKVYDESRVILLDLESFKTDTTVEQGFCFYKLS